jgi:hypothetical protein
VLDSVPGLSFRSGMWFFTVIAGISCQTFVVIAQYNNGVPQHSQDMITGDPMKYSVGFDVIGSNLVLSLNNLGVDPVTVLAVRFGILS